MFELMETLKIFYQEETLFKVCSVIILIGIPLGFLITSLVGQAKKVRGKFDVGALRRYHLAKARYVVLYLLCSIVTNIIVYPMMFNGFEMRTSIWCNVIIIVLCYAGLAVLFCLEAGYAAFMYIIIAGGITLLAIFDQYNIGKSSSYAFAITVLTLLSAIPILASGKYSLVKKYLGVRSIDFVD